MLVASTEVDLSTKGRAQADRVAPRLPESSKSQHQRDEYQNGYIVKIVPTLCVETDHPTLQRPFLRQGADATEPWEAF